MATTEKIVLVTGATGKQGGATARRLLADGWHVRALVRDPSGAPARALAEAGAHLVTGDMGDRASLDAAAEGAYGVFSIQPAGDAPADEVRLGVNVADAAHAAGVRHIVYTSVGGAERSSGISHWNTKWEIEQHIARLGLPATILRPVMFMENHASPMYGVLGEAPLINMFRTGATVQLIAVTDIGAFAGLAFADPGGYVGKALELAGDELTREELITAIGDAVGRRLNTAPIPDEILARQGVNLDDVHRGRSFGGWQADIPALRALHPGLMDFGTWLEREGKARFEALFAAHTV